MHAQRAQCRGRAGPHQRLSPSTASTGVCACALGGPLARPPPQLPPEPHWACGTHARAQWHCAMHSALKRAVKTRELPQGIPAGGKPSPPFYSGSGAWFSGITVTADSDLGLLGGLLGGLLPSRGGPPGWPLGGASGRPLASEAPLWPSRGPLSGPLRLSLTGCWRLDFPPDGFPMGPRRPDGHLRLPGRGCGPLVRFTHCIRNYAYATLRYSTLRHRSRPCPARTAYYGGVLTGYGFACARHS